MFGTDALDAFAHDPVATADRLRCAYVKTVHHEGGTAFAVHAADGTYLGRFPNRDVAFAALRQEDVEPASVH